MKNKSYDDDREEYISEGNYFIEADHMAGESVMIPPKRFDQLTGTTPTKCTGVNCDTVTIFGTCGACAKADELKFIELLKKQGWTEQI